MKLLILLTAGLLLIWGLIAHAAIPKIYGVNYGHNFAGHTYSPTQAGKDLDELKKAGVQAIRLYVGTYNNPEVDWTKKLAILAKQKGFIVTWGICSAGENFQGFLNSVDDYAKWAKDNNIDYFTIGNEEPDNNAIRDKAQEVKTLYSDLKITYATAAYQENINYWSNAGALDTIGFNVYVDFQNLTNQIKQNPKGIISEWNTDNGIRWARGSETRWAKELVKDRNIINTSGVKAYLFVIRGNGGGINNDWSMWVGSIRREAWKQLIR